MKKKTILFPVFLLILTLALAACGKTGTGSQDINESDSLKNAEESLNKDGSYTVKKGDLYIGINYLFEDGEYWELMTVCKSGKVVDCGRNSALMRFMLKEEYVGKTYEEAFKEFFYLNRPEEDHGEVKKISLIIMDDDKESKYESMLKDLRDEIAPKAEIAFTRDDKWHFDEAIVDFTLDYVVRLKEEEGRKAEEAARIQAEEDRIKAEDEKHAAEEEERRKEEEWLNSPVSTMAEIRERYEKNARNFTLSNDLVMDFDEGVPIDIEINCDNHAVIIKGCFGMELKGSEVSQRCIELKNASSVDMSGFSISDVSFKDENWAPEDRENGARYYHIIDIFNTSYKDVTYPEGILNRDDFDGRDYSVFEGYFMCEINDDGDQECITFVGPRATYEYQHEKDTAVVTEILTKGDALSILGEDYHGGYDVWTDVTVDVGNVTLPNQDYMGMTLRPGAKLKVTGTIALTGGKLDWEVNESDQLDLRGLTLVKKHPSPDMVKIRYNSKAGLNTDLLNVKAGKGKVSYVLGEEVFDISIW
jgi:hypothetical protein